MIARDTVRKGENLKLPFLNVSFNNKHQQVFNILNRLSRWLANYLLVFRFSASWELLSITTSTEQVIFLLENWIICSKEHPHLKYTYLYQEHMVRAYAFFAVYMKCLISLSESTLFLDMWTVRRQIQTSSKNNLSTSSVQRYHERCSGHEHEDSSFRSNHRNR